MRDPVPMSRTGAGRVDLVGRVALPEDLGSQAVGVAAASIFQWEGAAAA